MKAIPQATENVYPLYFVWTDQPGEYTERNGRKTAKAISMTSTFYFNFKKFVAFFENHFSFIDSQVLIVYGLYTITVGVALWW